MRKTYISAFIGLLVGIGLIFVWLQFVDFSEVTSLFSTVTWKYVIYSGIFYLLAYFIRSLRWNLLLRIRHKVSIVSTYMYCLAGNLINYLIPIRAGEVAKPFLLKKREGIAVTESFPSVIIDKFFDTIGIFVVLVLIPFLSIELSKALVILLVILIALFALGLLTLVLLSLKPNEMTKFLYKVMFFIPSKFKDKVMASLGRFVEGMTVLADNKLSIIPLILLTLVGVLCDAVYFYLIFLAFGINIGFTMVLFGYTLINLSYALPQTPAQIGTNEWMMSLIFSAGFGYDLNVAAAIMAFAHIYTAIILITSGSIALGYTGNGLLEIFKRRR